MSYYISLLNNIAVSIFGSVLAASFCNALVESRNRRFFYGCMLLLPIIEGWVYYNWDEEFLRRIYPLVVHVPLVLILSILTRKLLWSFISVLCAYLCCQLRRWVALLLVAVVSGGDMMQDVIELILTIPVLLLLLYFTAPAIRKLSDYPVRTQLQFGIIPALYYVFDYVTCVYTGLLQSGNQAAVEFMPFVCCVAYLAFLLYYSAREQVRNRLQQVQTSLNIQLTQAVREIDALRDSQTLTSQYRHDMRHHLQYLSSCIENGQTEQAQNYISTICEEINAQKVQRYCENEAANLILSAFAGRAKKDGILMNVQGSLSSLNVISDNDLCVIFSNALENAIHACERLAAEETHRVIDVQFYEKESKFFLQVINPCRADVTFQDGIPVTDKPGHGIGVQSICAIARRYGGVYTFLVQNGQFILRLSL